MLLEFSGVVALYLRRGDITAQRGLAIHAEFECFRQERLSLLEPRGADYFQARQWLQEFKGPPLRSGDVRWVPFIGQFWPLTSLTQGGRNGFQYNCRPHGEFCPPGNCGVLHGHISKGIEPS